jgi:hypothetical protein
MKMMQTIRNLQQSMTFQDLGRFGGSVIIGFQCTSHDHEAALRIYHSIDRVFEALITVFVHELPITHPLQPLIHSIFSQPFLDDRTGSRINSSTMFELIGYHPRTGKRTNVETDRVLLDLSARQSLILTCGVEKGYHGIVQGDPDGEGNIKILWMVPEIGASKKENQKSSTKSSSHERSDESIGDILVLFMLCAVIAYFFSYI